MHKSKEKQRAPHVGYKQQHGDGKKRVVGEATGPTLRDSSADNDSAKHFQNRHRLTDSKTHLFHIREASAPVGG